MELIIEIHIRTYTRTATSRLNRKPIKIEVFILGSLGSYKHSASNFHHFLLKNKTPDCGLNNAATSSTAPASHAANMATTKPPTPKAATFLAATVHTNGIAITTQCATAAPTTSIIIFMTCRKC